jgi:hypothetical protein
MSSKDYEKLAGTFKFCKPSKIAKPKGFSHRLEMWEGIVLEFCKTLSNENPRFNNEKFLTACGFFE